MIDRLSERFAGRVVEVVGVDGYVYVKVAIDGDERAPRWVVSLKKEILVDDRVDVAAFGSAEGFVSKKLGRTFDRLWFAVLAPSSVERGS